MIPINNIFRIRELRQRMGLTQRQLADRLGLKSPSTITMWEHGSRNPPSIMLPNLAQVLGCSISDLFVEEQDTTPKEEIQCRPPARIFTRPPEKLPV